MTTTHPSYMISAEDGAVVLTVKAPTYRDAKVHAFRIAAEAEARSGAEAWIVDVVRDTVRIELLKATADETARAEQILKIAAREAARK